LFLRSQITSTKIGTMARTRSKPDVVLGGTAEDVEASFYEGLRAGDLEKVMACWADDDDIVCIHPGGPRLLGTSNIRASFTALFAGGGSIPVDAESVQQLNAVASSVHHVLERAEVLTPQGPAYAHVLATNVYHKTPQGWRMVVHHASPAMPGQPPEVTQATKVLH
jgi:ketosteroid isomerase-like protein